MIYFHFENIPTQKIEKQKLKSWIKQSANSENWSIGNINIIYCSDEYLRDVNIKYLKHNYYTDVITFDSNDGRMLNGDIFISWNRVDENASEENVLFMDELKRIIIHGILHLMKYMDKESEDRKVMTEKENYYLEQYK